MKSIFGDSRASNSSLEIFDVARRFFFLMPAINHFLSRACEPDDERKGEERESFLSRFFSAEKDDRFMAVDVFKRDLS